MHSSRPSSLPKPSNFAPRTAIIAVGLASTILFMQTGRAAAVEIPSVTLSPSPAAPFIGTGTTIAVTFQNTGTSPGYGPYADLQLPPGLTYSSANFLGTGVTPLLIQTCASGTFTHPLTGLATPCATGSQVIVLQYPFGSFTPGQPSATINVATTLAASPASLVGASMPITASSGFAYGFSPTGTVPTTATLTTTSITPILYTLSKSVAAPDNETATGPNEYE